MLATIKKESSEANPLEPVDHSSSCASISLDVGDAQTTAELGDPTISGAKPNAASRRQLLSLMRVAVVKWQSRKQFFELRSHLENEQPTSYTLRRRRNVTDELLLTSSKGEEWAALVVRRFTKTPGRQIAGLRAILELQIEEENFYASGCLDRILKPGCPSRSYSLLKLVFLEFDAQSFFQDVVPAVIRDWSAHKPRAIVWLARVMLDLMVRIDGGMMARYGRQVIQSARPWTDEWLDGIWLLTALFLGQVAWTKDKNTMHYVSKFILHAGMEALGNKGASALGPTQQPDEATKLLALYPVIFTCLHSGGGETLHIIVPSAIALEPFIVACVDAICANGTMICSALKALALLRDIPAAMESIPPSKVSLLASCCTKIVLGEGLWRKRLLIEKCRDDPFTFIPEEDAFDILCRLPQPNFSRALAAALADVHVSLDSSSQDHLTLFDLLEPLLWLSNIPSSIPEAHRALVEGDACEFLGKIICDPPQEGWSWQDRGIWRAKGEAITCLGNIIEKMDEAELRGRLREDVIKAIVDIRDNTVAPLAQRDQATFTAQRYKTTAERCGAQPLCAKALAPERDQRPKASTGWLKWPRIALYSSPRS